MKTPKRPEEPEPKTEIGSMLTYRPLLNVEGMSEAILKDIAEESFSDALRSLGLTRVSFWIQRAPDASVVMWEGAEIETLYQRWAASSNLVISRWRGLLRMFSGPEVADGLWTASRDRLFSWATGEDGAESELMIFREPKQVEKYLQLARDYQRDPSLLGIVDRVRRRQGFTRIEKWHQKTNDGDVILTLFEAHQLDAAMAQRAAEENRLDQRIVAIDRATLLAGDSHSHSAKLLARWHA